MNPIRFITINSISVFAFLFLVTSSSAYPIFPDSFTHELYYQSTDNLRGIAVDGDSVYVANDTQGSVLHIKGSSTAETFSTGLNPGHHSKLAFDPSGAYGGDLFVCNPLNRGGGIDPIYRISPDGNTSLFFADAPGHFDLLTSGLAFGQGGGFGSSMYIQDVEHDDLLVVFPDSSWTELGSGVSGFHVTEDIEITNDNLFGNYAYLTDQRHNWIFRMTPAGTTEVFTPGLSGRALASGVGSFGTYLYLGTKSGEIFMLDQYGNADLFISGFDGIIEDIAFGRHSMWVTVEGQGLYRVNNSHAPVSEPSTMILIGSGLIGLAGLRKSFKI